MTQTLIWVADPRELQGEARQQAGSASNYPTAVRPMGVRCLQATGGRIKHDKAVPKYTIPLLVSLAG